jgi:hypothetical protein
MDRSCPSLPPKILVADNVRPNAQTTAFMAAHGCHFVECFWYVLLVIIESFFLAVRNHVIARTLLYKVSIAIVSRSFYEKTITAASIRFSSPQLPVIHRAQFWLDRLEVVLQDWPDIVVADKWTSSPGFIMLDVTRNTGLCFDL